MTTEDARRKTAWTSGGAWGARGARRWARRPPGWTCEGGSGGGGGEGGSVGGSRVVVSGAVAEKRLGTPGEIRRVERVERRSGRAPRAPKRPRGTLGDGARWEGILAGRIVRPARASPPGVPSSRESAVVPPGRGSRRNKKMKGRGGVAHLMPSPRRPPAPSSSTLNASSLRNIVAVARLVDWRPTRRCAPRRFPTAQSARLGGCVE